MWPLSEAPGQTERMGGGRTTRMLSHLPWVGSRSFCRGQEEIKLPAFVVALKEGNGEKRGVYSKQSYPSIQDIGFNSHNGGLRGTTFKLAVIMCLQRKCFRY